jgi:hypothetical protein
VGITRLRGAAVAAAITALALTSTPAQAGSTSVADPSGVDFDAACRQRHPQAPPAAPDDVPSPGANANCLAGTYDGSTEATDVRGCSLSSNGVDNAGPSDTQLVATCSTDGPMPPAGGTCNPAFGGAGCPDLPDGSYVGYGWNVMFQVPARHNNQPTNPAGGGCASPVTGQAYDQHGHWTDGSHFLIGFAVTWRRGRWVHSAEIGAYDPSPSGGYVFTDLGTNDGSGWVDADPNMTFGTNWDVTYGAGGHPTVTVDGVVGEADAVNCANGVFYAVHAKAGDGVVNVKGVSTASNTIVLPVTIPLSLIPGFGDVTSVGGFLFYSDVTPGNSANQGVIGTALESLGLGIREGVAYTGGFLATSDTLGESPACPAPTFGGIQPPNPFANTAVGCLYDDDNVPVPNPTGPLGPWTAMNPGERGTFLTEWWDTDYGFTA